MTWLYLALLSTLLYAITNLFDDNLLRYIYKSPYISTTSAGLYGILPLLSLFFVSFGHISFGFALLSIIAGILTISYYFLYFRSLTHENPSVVVATLTLAPATLPIFAYIFLNEILTIKEIIGFIIILLASFAITVVDIKKFKFSKALPLLLIAILLINFVSIDTKYVYTHVEFFTAYMCFSIGMGIGGLIFFLSKYNKNKIEIKRIKKYIKKLLPVFILVELIGLLAELSLNLAISKGPVSLVRVVEGIQPIIVLLLAILLFTFAPQFFREAKSNNIKRKFIFMFIAVIGLTLIA